MRWLTHAHTHTHTQNPHSAFELFKVVRARELQTERGGLAPSDVLSMVKDEWDRMSVDEQSPWATQEATLLEAVR